MLGSSFLRAAVTAIAARRNVVAVKTVEMTFKNHFDGHRVDVQLLRKATAERQAFYVFSAPGVESVGYSGRQLSASSAEEMEVVRSSRDGRLYLQEPKQFFADFSAKPASPRSKAKR